MELYTIVETFIIEEQNLLQPLRSCIDFVITRSQFGDKEFNFPTLKDFIGVEKAFDEVSQQKLCEKHSDPQHLFRAIHNLCLDNSIR